jgi:orotate phosphoribosyltransferase-like protein
MNPLTEMVAGVCEDLEPHAGEFDAIVCAGDFHGVALAAVIASVFDKPLMMICRDPRNTQSLIVPIGDLDFHRMRYLYVDDAFTFGKSLRNVFDYVNSCGEPAPITATYEVNTRKYKEVTA